MKLITTYYSDGEKKEEYWRKKCGKLTGEYKKWHLNGNIWIENKYINGKPEGKHITWYSDGQKAVEKTYKNGKVEGLYIEWISGGNRWKEYNYVNGVLEGSYKRWYYSTDKFIECTYTNGRLDGEYKLWTSKGTYQSYTYYFPLRNVNITSMLYPYNTLKKLIKLKKKSFVRRKILQLHSKITALNILVYDCILSYLEEGEKITILRDLKLKN